ncbi:OmpP1/FadL family transporter [Solemya velesiana gill symbiont]|uniref:Aromatic hydrocarbon degradation protein n=1 Tax=Solemya velesiana gill symbiont TaxID=1918948 RepID=A0A1T2KWQ0_9GAMM|nr:porin [Solemya velesiana gill symbiont]OOZ37221.1 hypothetical protein BOW51_03275 [Solemya velesiana gill symbiont]
MSSTHNFALRTLAVACGLALAGLSQQAAASGFAVPEISITGLGTSNALVANPDELGAVPYNPAAMTNHPTSISFGAMAVAPSLEVTTATTGTHESQGSDIIGIPQFQGTYRYNDKVAFGLGVSAPFGLESIWDADAPTYTNPVFAGLGPFHPTESKIETVDINPTLAFKLDENTSMAVGLDYYWIKTIVFNAPLVQIKGDGGGWGMNVGLLYEQDRWSFGFNYHSSSEVTVKGSANDIATNSARAWGDLTIPWRLQTGVRYEATDKLALEFDITRTGWDSFNVLQINHSGGLVAPSPIESNNHWEDANAYRIGATYDLNAKTQLRFGYTYDETGQPDLAFSPRVPDSDRHLFSIGVGHDYGNGWSVEGGYMYVKFEDRNFRGAATTPWIGASDFNGSNRFDGDYESSVHLVGIGLSKTF